MSNRFELTEVKMKLTFSMMIQAFKN
jgi:hypothetical protein